jgi:hypothetical protein
MRLFRRRRLAALGLGTALLAAFAAPAMASTAVNVSLSTPANQRTLNLYQPNGSTPLTSTDLSTGSSNFIAQVVDNGYSDTSFTVQATMSNLYSYVNGAYQCSATPVPSSAITLSSPSGLLTVGGVSAAVTPVFQMIGTLTSTQLPVLGTSTVNLTGTTVDGTLPTTPISQSTLTGSSATSLFGSTLSGVEGDLPVSLSAPATGTAFTNPDVQPTCDPNATGATPAQIMHGTANPTGLLSDLVSEITAAVGTATPTLQQLVTAGYLTSSAVSAVLAQNTTLMNALGGLTGLTSDLSTILGDITSSISSSGTNPMSLLSGATSQSGNYESSPTLAVTVPSTATGTYQGVMTVTLLDQ